MKIGVFVGLAFLVSVFLGRVVGLFFASSFFEFLGKFPGFLLTTVFGLILAGPVFCLPALFLTTQGLLLAVLLNCVGFLFGFWLVAGFQGCGPALILALLYFGCQYLFFRGVQGRARKFISFFPRDIFVPKVITLLFHLTLVFSLSFYFALKGEIARGEFVIPEKVFEQVTGPASQIFQKSLQQGLQMQFGKELEKEIGTRSPEEVAEFLQEEVKETAGEGRLRQKFGFRPEIFELKTLDPRQLKIRLESVIRPFLKYLPVVAAVSLFFTLRLVVNFLLIFLPWLISGMFWVLIRFGVLRIVEERRTVRRLSL